MGVFRYFRYLLNTYKGQFYECMNKESQFAVDMLLIDCNAIFHPACREIFFPENVSILRKKPSYEELEAKAFKNVTDKLEELIRMCPPRKLLYLAIDGVAGMCKQSQQRKRRYKTAKDRKQLGTEADDVFDTCNISAGTPFMERLSKYMQDWIVRIKQYPYRTLQIIFDGMHVVSEGEHKLVKYLYNPKNCNYKSTYCIVSPDADLIFLAMCIPHGRGYILRENIYTDITGKFLLVDCYKLKGCISDSINWNERTYGSLGHSLCTKEAIEEKQVILNDYDIRKAVKDYILFLFLVGNDFLPCMYAFDISNDGIEILQNCYTSAASTKGYLSDVKNNMCYEPFLQLFDQLSQKEEYMLTVKSTKTCKNPDSLLKSCVGKDDVGKLKLDFSILRRQYYERKFGQFSEEFVEEVSKAYLRGLHFVLTYYTIAIPSYAWFYEYHYAPFAIDIYNTIKKMELWEWNKIQEWEYKPPLTLKQSLMGVIPPSSYKVLPEEIQSTMLKHKDDPLFSEEFEVDLEGKQQDYEGICLLPNVTYTQLKRFVKDKWEDVKCPILYK